MWPVWGQPDPFVWGQTVSLWGNRSLFYHRFAATAAIFLLLGGCSLFGDRDTPETPAKVPASDSQDRGGPLDGIQLAALSGYLSDQDVAPGGIAADRGIAGSRTARTLRVTAAVQLRPIAPGPTLADLLPPGQVLDLQPISAGFLPTSGSLASLIEDRDWRKRTSETLDRLFQ